jgi:hypothetical protein
VAPSGSELARTYFEHVVRPVVAARWPQLPYAAARLGSGSDVLGLDDAMSTDHDWGLRLNLLVPDGRNAAAGAAGPGGVPGLAAEIDSHLSLQLPDSFAGHPTRFATTWDPRVRHRVQVETARDIAVSRLGVDPTHDLTVGDWLSLTGQAVLEVTGGEVFVDDVGELDGIRRRLQWYPDDLWRHLVAVDWARLAQELPVVGRTGERGDEVGSRVVAGRLTGVAMHLAHLLERRWPPYTKWLATSFAELPRAGAARTAVLAAVSAGCWREREAGLVEALRLLNRVQADAGLPTLADPVEPFWDRPYRGVRDAAVTVLTDGIGDPAVRALPRGVGSVEQWSDNVDVLTDVGRPRRRTV